MIEEVASTPDWLAFFQYGGIVAGALVPMALLFKGCRSWLVRRWRALIGSRVSQRQFSETIETLRDEIGQKIGSIDHKIDTLVAGFSAIDKSLERVGLMESMLRWSADRDEQSATLYFDERGSATFVSRPLTTWLRASRSDLMGWNWLNFVTATDRKAIRDELALAHTEHREVRMTINMCAHNEPPKPYLLTIVPMPDNPPARAWAGNITPMFTDPETLGH